MKVFHEIENTTNSKSQVAILMPDKIHFKMKAITKDKDPAIPLLGVYLDKP